MRGKAAHTTSKMRYPGLALFELREVRMETVDISSLYVEYHGPASAPAIVFLHGGGVGGWMWKQQVEVFNRRFRCIVPDMPGQERSQAAGAFSHELAAEMTAELIRRKAPGGKAHLVGLSEGAQVTVALLSRDPSVVDHAFISSALLRPIPGAWMYSRPMLAWTYRLAMAPFRGADWYIRMNMKGAAGVPDKFFPEFKSSFQSTGERAFVETLYHGTHYHMPAGLEKANRPALVVVGEKEYGVMKRSARELLAKLPNSKGAMVSLGKGSRLAAEHNWAITAPDLFNRTLLAFLEDRSLPEGLKPLE
jgi:pimeloyl-ACP methyl ester carboxylesterase